MYTMQVSPRAPSHHLFLILRSFACAGGRRRYHTHLDYTYHNSALTNHSRSVMVESPVVANAWKVGVSSNASTERLR